MFDTEKHIVARAMTKAGHSVEFIGLVLRVKARRQDGLCFIGNYAIFTCVVCDQVFMRQEYKLRKRNGHLEGVKTCSGKCRSKLMNDAKNKKYKEKLPLTSHR